METAACDQVWQTEELRDMILLHLPLRRLLTVRQICKAWCNSPLINQVLFLNPGQGPRIEYAADEVKGNAWKTVAGGGTVSRTDGRPILHSGGHELTHKPIVNLILCDLELLYIGWEDGAFPGCLVVRTWEGHLQDTSSGESFLQMQLTYPPAQKLSFTCLGDELLQNLDAQEGDADEPEDSDYTWFDVTKDTGVTVRDLIEAMRAHFHGCSVCMQEADDSEFFWRLHGAHKLADRERMRSGHRLLAAMRRRTIKKENQNSRP
ncbi:uncharacterized protein CLAFUR5_10485 [Fulvia fulva]|uniref:F-box domain-containing protein n=1 Tax=Passalora fulva TaxID=5499 RepID=A0A9Q8PBV6_PASFU|nr:uncharacterized protein CLAFUR5_10485 [Fulvia fulva]KAK4621045.1 hypothetical protein CLAFUR0_11457 [Fulvia fulva]UJO19664.1 hypothetical protein CLAFUR5_10485 [Fulvia fulva]